MVAHHGQTEVVAELAVEHAVDPEVKGFAERIMATEGREGKQRFVGPSSIMLTWPSTR